MRSSFLLAGLLLAAPSFAASERTWSVVPGFYQPGAAGIHVLDLDGDGREEAIVSGTSNGGFGQGSARFIALLERVGNGLDVTGVTRLGAGESFASDMHVLPAAGAARRFAMLIEKQDDTRALVTYAGKLPQRVASVPMPASFHLDGIGDVDGDGQLEAFGTNVVDYDGGRPQIRDFATGAVEWTDPARTTAIVGAGQLDGDPALELVFGAAGATYNSNTGYVLDGATRAEQWSWPDGFRGTPVFGNFDTVPATREFAVVESWGTTRVFVSAPFFSPLTDYPTGEVQAIAVRDVEGDLVDEIIIGQGQWGNVIAYKPTTWAKTFNHDNPEHGVSAIGIGQLDDDIDLEVVFGAGLTSSGGDLLRVFDAGFDTVQYSRLDSSGPYSASVVADLDGNGRREVVWASLSSDSGYGGPNIVVSDAATGAELRRLDDVLDPWGANAGARLLTANLDADPALEIVIGSGYTYDGRVRVLDGVTLQQQWTAQLNDVDVVRDLALFTANADAVPDLAVAAQGRVIVLDGSTGAEVWRSVSVTANTPQNVATGDIDGDGAPELLSTLGNTLYAIDGATRLFERSIAHGAPILDAAAEGSGPACRIVVYEATRLVRRRCDTGAIDTLREYGLTALMVRPLADSHGTLVLSDGSQLFLLEGAMVIEASEAVGPELGWGNLGTVQATGEGIEVYTGDLVSMHRFVLAKSRVMRDGFE